MICIYTHFLLYQTHVILIILVTTYTSRNSKRKSNKMQHFYFILKWSSTCFGRHTAHYQEPKTALAASDFAYVASCWTCSCWTLTASSNYTANNLLRIKNQRLLVQFRLLMMGGVSPETCWASYKYKIKIFIHCCILLGFLCELYCDARIHEHQVILQVY